MDKKLVETLGKVIIAVAWADKKMAPEEIDSLKDLLYQFQQTLTFSFNLRDELWAASSGFYLDSTSDNYGLMSRQQALFDIYTDSPIDAAERERLINELKEAVWSKEDKTLVLSTLKSMVEADSKVTEDEQVVLNSIVTTMESIDTGTLGDLGRLIRGAIQRRSDAVNNTPNKEKYFDEFLKNKIYYDVRHSIDSGERNLEIPDEELRKLSMAGGLMARVAQIDNVVLEKEKDKITSIFQTNWGINQEGAAFVVEVALAEGSANFDYLRMSREFTEITQPAERASFLDILFAVANADEKISDDELKEIYHIADYLLMSSNRVMEARSKFIKGK